MRKVTIIALSTIVLLAVSIGATYYWRPWNLAQEQDSLEMLETLFLVHPDHFAFVEAMQRLDYERAHHHALVLSEIPEFSALFWPHEALGDVAVRTGNFAQACEHFSAALRLAREQPKSGDSPLPAGHHEHRLARRLGELGCVESDS